MKRWKWIFMTVAVFSLLAAGAWAQDFPKGPINFMNPFNPGGEVDIEARAMQPSLEKNLGVPFVINYLPGAGERSAGPNWLRPSRMGTRSEDSAFPISSFSRCS